MRQQKTPRGTNWLIAGNNEIQLLSLEFEAQVRRDEGNCEVQQIMYMLHNIEIRHLIYDIWHTLYRWDVPRIYWRGTQIWGTPKEGVDYWMRNLLMRHSMRYCYWAHRVQCSNNEALDWGKVSPECLRNLLRRHSMRQYGTMVQ